MKPVFEHDCERCVFLGTVQRPAKYGPGRREHGPDDPEATAPFDLYFCPGEPTIIARWSSDGPDYMSGICFGVSALVEGREGYPLRDAFERARERGLDMGEQGNLSKVSYCREHGVYVPPGTQCWDCGMKEIERLAAERDAKEANHG